LITQMAQTAVCNRLHSLEQAVLPLAPSEPRPAGGHRDSWMTHELIANMLGRATRRSDPGSPQDASAPGSYAIPAGASRCWNAAELERHAV
jgi:hypothetical protein